MEELQKQIIKDLKFEDLEIGKNKNNNIIVYFKTKPQNHYAVIDSENKTIYYKNINNIRVRNLIKNYALTL